MRVLIVHPNLAPVGGAEKVAVEFVRTLQGLSSTQVSILSLSTPADFIESVGRHEWDAGPMSRAEWIGVDLPRPLRAPGSGPALVQAAVVHRKAKRIAGSFDLCISTFNEIDFGRPGIQYVHCPMYAHRDVLRRYEIIPPHSSFYRSSWLEYPYDVAIRLISGRRTRGILTNRTLVNSSFMQTVVKEAYGVDSEVVYPPVSGLAESDSTEPNRDVRRFVYLGRITPDKYVERLVSLFGGIHGHVPQSRLTIAGHAPDPTYLRSLESSITDSGMPIDIRTNLTDTEVWTLLRECGFLINPKPFEHFGISVAEGIRAGCLPFVSNVGGVTEIVPSPELQFGSAADLGEKARVLFESQERRETLLKTLRDRLDLFSEERFRERIQEVVLDSGGRPAGTS